MSLSVTSGLFYMHVHVRAIIHDPKLVFFTLCKIVFRNGNLRPAFVVFIFGDYEYLENINVDVNYETKWKKIEIHIPFVSVF